MNFSRNILILFSVLFLLSCLGCQSRPDLDALKSEIRDLHRQTIEAHFAKNIDLFTKDLSEEFISVSNGEILFPTKQEINAQFSSYLKSTEFTEYKNLREPIIGIADDGSVGWSVVQVKVAGKRMLENGSQRDLNFTCAWITLYQREGDRWIRTAEVSNFQ